jgi:hypothetical protein
MACEVALQTYCFPQEPALELSGAEEKLWDHGKQLGSRRSGAAALTPRHSHGPPRLVGEESYGVEPLKSLSTPRTMSRGTVFEVFPVSKRSGILWPFSVVGVCVKKWKKVLCDWRTYIADSSLKDIFTAHWAAANAFSTCYVKHLNKREMMRHFCS